MGNSEVVGLQAEKFPLQLSIIVPVFNCLSLTHQFLDSLVRTLPAISYEVIIIDDGSTDGTRDFLATLRPPFRIFLNKERKNYAANNNWGVRLAEGEILALLNNDLVLTPGWLEPMLATLRALPRIGAVGNIHINAQTNLIDHAGVAFDLEGIPFHIHKNRKKFPSGPYRECNAASCACFLTYRPIFQKIGGFDEQFLNGSEDIDFCVRLKLAGYHILVSHQSRVYHYISSSPGRFDHTEANQKRFLSKWQPVTAQWGASEWPREYFRRYARHFWKMTPHRMTKALLLLAKDRFAHRTR